MLVSRCHGARGCGRPRLPVMPLAAFISSSPTRSVAFVSSSPSPRVAMMQTADAGQPKHLRVRRRLRCHRLPSRVCLSSPTWQRSYDSTGGYAHTPTAFEDARRRVCLPTWLRPNSSISCCTGSSVRVQVHEISRWKRSDQGRRTEGQVDARQSIRPRAVRYQATDRSC